MAATSILPVVAKPPVSLHTAPDAIPRVFRLTELEVARTGQRLRCVAHLFHRQATLSVTWSTTALNAELKTGALVCPQFPTRVATESGKLVVSDLCVPCAPERDLNLFDTVRPERTGQPDFVERARTLVDQLSPGYRHLFNAVFWDQRRFARFLRQPGSIRNHHTERCGLLVHTVETAEIALALCQLYECANLDLVLITALLHDAGKADEYCSKPNGASCMTDRGRLIGHTVTLTEWIAVAVANCDIDLPEHAYEALLHVLNARKNAPEWLGIRAPVMIEHDIVSFADGLSGRMNLHGRLAAPQGGWGLRHPHRPAPFTLLETS